MNYFDPDASFSNSTPSEEMTYIAIQNILNDEKHGWVQETYRDHDIQRTSYDIPIHRLKNNVNHLQEKADQQALLIENMQKKGTDVSDARVTMVNLLDTVDSNIQLLEDYILNDSLEKLRLNKLHNISYIYKINKDKDILAEKTKSLMDYIVSNRVTIKNIH